MTLFKTIESLEHTLKKMRKQGKTIGFVPTMGALHQGHISLIKAAKAQNDFCICSIFVNPTQFNNRQDFLLYPESRESDIDMLYRSETDFVFMPAENEMYPSGEIPKQYNLGYVEHILEGKYRPGHYQGVCRIIDKFLHIIKPDQLYLGQKDYQQCMVIDKLLQLKKFNTTLQVCPTVREKSGLAMSSRNRRLNEKQQALAEKINETLQRIQKKLQPGSVVPIQKEAVSFLQKNGFNVDYVEIANADDLRPVQNWDGKTSLIVLIAAFVGEIRLIDNLMLH